MPTQKKLQPKKPKRESSLVIHLRRVATDDFNKTLGKDLFTVGMICEMLDRSYDTITRWRKEGHVIPSCEYVSSNREYRVVLYTKSDLRKARAFANKMDAKIAVRKEATNA